jgi:hypothetical protein
MPSSIAKTSESKLLSWKCCCRCYTAVTVFFLEFRTFLLSSTTHLRIPANKKIRKAARPQPAKETSSPYRNCSHATFRQSHQETHTIMDRSLPWRPLWFRCPLTASDVGSSSGIPKAWVQRFFSVFVWYHTPRLISSPIRHPEQKFTFCSSQAVRFCAMSKYVFCPKYAFLRLYAFWTCPSATQYKSFFLYHLTSTLKSRDTQAADFMIESNKKQGLRKQQWF